MVATTRASRRAQADVATMETWFLHARTSAIINARLSNAFSAFKSAQNMIVNGDVQSMGDYACMGMGMGMGMGSSN